MLKSYGWGGGPLDFSDSPESKFLFPSLDLDLDSGLSIIAESSILSLNFKDPAHKRKVTQPLVDLIRKVANERGLTDVQLAGALLR